MTSLEKGKKIKDVLLNKKAINVILLELTYVTILTDYFVLATGINKKQVKQFAYYCEKALEEEGVFKLRKETSEDWVLLIL